MVTCSICNNNFESLGDLKKIKGQPVCRDCWCKELRKFIDYHAHGTFTEG